MAPSSGPTASASLASPSASSTGRRCVWNSGPLTRRQGERAIRSTSTAAFKIIEEHEEEHPDAVVSRGSKIPVAADAAADLIDRAERGGVGILGLEGFLISVSTVYPALSRIADFSRSGTSDADFVRRSAAEARQLLAGEWSSPPGPVDQIHPEAKGPYMLAVVLKESA
jgi:hypothetical protein